jgi:hypothetical protein
MQFALRACVDETLALSLTFIQRRLHEISKETEDLRRQLHEIQLQQQEQFAVVARTLLQELQADQPERH